MMNVTLAARLRLPQVAAARESVKNWPEPHRSVLPTLARQATLQAALPLQDCVTHDVCPCYASRSYVFCDWEPMLTDMEQKLRKRTERAISAYLLDAYSIEGDVSTVVKGVNWTLVVRDGVNTAAYVRLYRTSCRSPVDIPSELTVLRSVQGTPGLQVSRPFEDRLGRTSSEIELPDGTRRPIAVFAPAIGREMAATTADFGRAGAALADLHRQSALERLAPEREILHDDVWVRETVAMIADRGSRVAETISSALDELESLRANTLLGPTGFCYGDVRPANMRIDGERVTFFDFDDCGTGPQWLGVAAMALWLEVLYFDNAGALWRAFLAAYGLTDSETLSLSVRWLVTQHQLRIVRFLFDYCDVEATLMRHVLKQSQALISNAAYGGLRALSSHRD